LATIFFKILKRIQHLKKSVLLEQTKGNTAPHKKPEVINEQIVPTTNGNNNSSVNQVAATKVYQNTTVINETVAAEANETAMKTDTTLVTVYVQI
jgi:hypothetical protein